MNTHACGICVHKSAFMCTLQPIVSMWALIDTCICAHPCNPFSPVCHACCCASMCIHAKWKMFTFFMKNVYFFYVMPNAEIWNEKIMTRSVQYSSKIGWAYGTTCPSLTRALTHMGNGNVVMLTCIFIQQGIRVYACMCVHPYIGDLHIFVHAHFFHKQHAGTSRITCAWKYSFSACVPAAK